MRFSKTITCLDHKSFRLDSTTMVATRGGIDPCAVDRCAQPSAQGCHASADCRSCLSNKKTGLQFREISIGPAQIKQKLMPWQLLNQVLVHLAI